jgi:hypothetical protein
VFVFSYVDDAEITSFLEGGLASGSVKNHRRNWGWWSRFTEKNGIDAWLDGVTEAGKIRWVIRFIIQLLKGFRRSAKQIRDAVSSIHFTFRTTLRSVVFLEDRSVELAKNACNRSVSGRELNFRLQARRK